jgi:hypothetical protein
LRVGSLDGLNLHLSNAYSVADEGTRQRFVFANASPPGDPALRVLQDAI